MTLCECGCGYEAKEGHRFINRHHVRNMSDETKKKIAKKNKGNKCALGNKLSDNTKKKMSESRKGKQPTLGYHHTEEVKQKIRDSLSGEKSPNWKGGISFEPYCHKFNTQFKESVREQFDRKCFLCGVPENGAKLSVHHVNYDKSCLCSKIECEFVPLCASCHGKTSNGDRAEWENKIIAKLATYI